MNVLFPCFDRCETYNFLTHADVNGLNIENGLELCSVVQVETFNCCFILLPYLQLICNNFYHFSFITLLLSGKVYKKELTINSRT